MTDWRKYSLTEFCAADEGSDDGEDFKTIDPGWLEFWQGKLVEFLNSQEYHYGDCTKVPVACSLCVVQGMLESYREYFRDPEKYYNDNWKESE